MSPKQLGVCRLDVGDSANADRPKSKYTFPYYTRSGAVCENEKSLFLAP